jgi:hypothetical protein
MNADGHGFRFLIGCFGKTIHKPQAQAEAARGTAQRRAHDLMRDTQLNVVLDTLLNNGNWV